MSWEENVRRAVPYTPGEQPGSADIIKLNTNENLLLLLFHKLI